VALELALEPELALVLEPELALEPEPVWHKPPSKVTPPASELSQYHPPM